ncbi:MAG: hypothetical protein LBP59_10445 [Planctomycetaceae bacterium]|jgi:hypothetical protein|nr:hypothetical protein [Planctomycetaceae bacterium]
MFEFNTKILPESLPDVSLFTKYLSNTGWKKIEQDNPNIVTYGTLQYNKKGLLIDVPVDDSFSDSNFAVLRAIQRIANVRSVDETDILNEVFLYDYDILQQRFITTNKKSRMYGIPLNFMTSFLNSTYDMIQKTVQMDFMVKDQVEPNNTNYVLMPSDHAVKYSKKIAENCLFGHTFRGSFGISVDIPNQVRRVTERIAIGIKDVVDATLHGERSIIVKNYRNGFNADLCRSLISIMESIMEIAKSDTDSEFNNLEVEYSFKWSPISRLNSTYSLFEPVILSPKKVIPILKAAEQELIYLNQVKQTTTTKQFTADYAMCTVEE